jgi:hypothetical protein
MLSVLARSLAVRAFWPILAASTTVTACSGDDKAEEEVAALAPKNPDRAPEAMVDRFSADAGMLQVRNADNGLPAAGAPIDFDEAPFITQGLGPNGERVRYYNFDVQPTLPAPIYVLVRGDQPVAGQLNIVDVLPGQRGYNDFWRVTRVTVPEAYEANTVTSLSEIEEAGYAQQETDMLVNCPIVTRGSTARLRLGSQSTALVRGWYQGQVVYYFSFEERALMGAEVPVAPIYVTFNINPDRPGGGPSSGFRTEAGSPQTHNVISALPADDGYSPLWSVSPYDNADFDRVTDLAAIGDVNVLARGAANVNCPVVDVEE